jgi:hypothetical protein
MQVCKVCGEEILGDRFLISRADNKTHICPICGTKETLEDCIKAGAMSYKAAEEIINDMIIKEYHKEIMQEIYTCLRNQEIDLSYVSPYSFCINFYNDDINESFHFRYCRKLKDIGKDFGYNTYFIGYNKYNHIVFLTGPKPRK